MTDAICRLKDQTHGDWRRITRTAVSAGFVENGACFGGSETLCLSSHKDDTALLLGTLTR